MHGSNESEAVRAWEAKILAGRAERKRIQKEKEEEEAKQLDEKRNANKEE